MKLLEVELWNVCQHRHALIKFSPGLTAVTGPNGAGKTNLMSAVYAGITGDFSRFELNRQGLISQYADKDEDAGIRVLIEHHGVTAEIKRMLRPNTRSLVIGNEPPIVADKQMTLKIEEWFGLPIKVIGQYIFVNQWQMFSLLNESPTERAKDLYRLFDLGKAEACYTALGDKIVELNNTTFCAIDADVVRSRLLANRSQLRELEKRLKVLLSRKASDDQVALLEAVSEAWRYKVNLSEKISFLNDEIARIDVNKETLDDKINIVNSDLAIAEERLATLSSRLDDSQSRMTSWAAYSEMEKRKAVIFNELSSVESELNGSVVRPLPVNYVEFSKHAEVEEEIHNIRHLIQMVDAYLAGTGGSAEECPVCGTPASEFKDRFDEHIDKLPIYTTRLNELTSALNDSKAYDAEKVKYVMRVKFLNEKQESLTHMLSSVDVVSKPLTPRVDEIDVNKIKVELSALKYRIDYLKKAVEKLTHDRARLDGVLQARLIDLGDTINKYEEITITETDADKAQSVLSVHGLESQQKSQIQAEISVMKRIITDDETMLEESEQASKLIERVAKWKDQLIAVRDVMHRDALPRLIAQSHLEKLEASMNGVLSDLGVDFGVKSQDGLKFDVFFNDGVRRVPAEALSGGEKVVFALAWRLSVNSEFASDIGVLCLDEPTAGLDKDRLNCLKTAIEHMRKMSQSRGLQCIIITHADNLMSLFDHVIELKQPVIV